MDAIFGLVLALITAIPESLMGLTEPVLQLLSLFVEFIIIAIRRGPREAVRQCGERRREQLARRKDRAQDAQKRNSLSLPTTLLTVSLILCVIVGWMSFEALQARRKEQTERQVAQKAEEIIKQIQKKPKKLPEPGPLPDRDGWGRPLELFVDKFPLGSMIVVRSCGRDGQPGTLDDLIAIETSTPAIDVGEEIVKYGIAKLQKLLNKPK